MRDRVSALRAIYDRYEEAARGFKEQAACSRGCTSCCTIVGNVDIVTLEGLVIREGVGGMAPEARKEIRRRLAENRSRYEKRIQSDCAFLDEEGACVVYDIRPFSCRQLYSVRKCEGSGPTVHRQAVELARETVKEIQMLDEKGYSGHLSYIFYLLDDDRFRETYLSGGFNPGPISAFAKSHGILINRFACR